MTGQKHLLGHRSGHCHTGCSEPCCAVTGWILRFSGTAPVSGGWIRVCAEADLESRSDDCFGSKMHEQHRICTWRRRACEVRPCQLERHHSPKAAAIWPVIQNVDDGNEHGFGTHFKVITCENPARSSIFLLGQLSAEEPQNPWIQVTVPAKGEAKQTKILRFFGPV